MSLGGSSIKSTSDIILGIYNNISDRGIENALRLLCAPAVCAIL